jgi:radical SAM protein with 4Fe4S-binding SPASM domain
MFADFLHRISSLSIRKVYNVILVHLSYFFSVLLKKPLVWGKPFFISIEPAAVCNLACPQCPTGAGDVKRGKPYLEMDTFRAVVDEVAGTTAVLSLYHQGEPLMHSSFAEMVRYATDRRIYTMTSTNGQMLTEDGCQGLVEAGLDRIIISLDGTDQESYGKYRRGGEFEKVTQGIRLLNEARLPYRKPYIILQFLVFKHNQDQVHAIRRLGKRLGADRVMIKSAQIEYPDCMEAWLPEGKKFSRYHNNSQGEWVLRGNQRNRCRRLWQTTVITTDEMVIPCCFDKLAKYPMGSLGKETLHQIWKSRAYHDFRRRILKNRAGREICRNCTEGIGSIYI